MSALDALQSVQYVSLKGKRFAVVSAEDWEALIEWLEGPEDSRVVQEAIAALKAAGGDRGRAGWQQWNEVAHDVG